MIDYQLGMSRKCNRLNLTDYVTVLCTHRPSLLPIGSVRLFLTQLRLLKFSLLPRGRRSRNKVSVGEPAVGSLVSNYLCLNRDLVKFMVCYSRAF